MKTLIIFASCCLFGLTSYAQTPTAEETLEWLNIKKDRIYSIESEDVDDREYINGKTRLYDCFIEFTESHVKVYNDNGAWTTLNWSNIKDVRGTDLNDNYNFSIKIVSATIDKKTKEGKWVYFRLNPKDLGAQFVKALEHMAKLKGADLIKDDLFGE